jgi:hypothetical protein
METLRLKVSCLCVTCRTPKAPKQDEDGDIIYLICFTHHFNLFHFHRINFAVVSGVLFVVACVKEYDKAKVTKIFKDYLVRWDVAWGCGILM